MNDKRKIITDILGSYRRAGDEHLYHCPFCKHHKKKLSVNTEKACNNIFAVGQHDIGNGQKYIWNVAKSKINQVTLDEVMTRFVSYIRKDESFNVKESDIELKTMMFHYCLKVRSPFSLKNIMHERTATPVQLYKYIKALKQLNIVTELVD